MGIEKIKPNAGQGGKLGRSKMAYGGTNAEAKSAARRRRRLADRDAIAEQVAELEAPADREAGCSFEGANPKFDDCW